MSIIVWLIVGGVVGWLASLIMRTDAQQGIATARQRAQGAASRVITGAPGLALESRRPTASGERRR